MQNTFCKLKQIGLLPQFDMQGLTVFDILFNKKPKNPI